MPNFFERASAGLNSLMNDAAIRARAAKSTTSALGKVGGEFGERLGRALQHAATLSRKNRELETDELCDLQVGANCYADSPGFMRTQLWGVPCSIAPSARAGTARRARATARRAISWTTWRRC